MAYFRSFRLASPDGARPTLMSKSVKNKLHVERPWEMQGVPVYFLFLMSKLLATYVHLCAWPGFEIKVITSAKSIRRYASKTR